ncbi:MAG TPA: hypothetical protein VLC79_08940 [Cellvibrio sp.]|nr:hypothetical protein [Cellvibrio sp.]
MISLTAIATLNLLKASHKHRHAHLSAASGLVQVGDFLYVIADDENHLAVFSRQPDFKGKLIELFPGDLPLSLEERKAAKADLEVLTQIPASKRHPYGALLALGSGSKETRRKGAIIALDEKNELANVELIDLEELYDEVKNKIGKLNIEGAVIIEKDIILFQRGNKKNKLNASIRIPLKDFYLSVLDTDKKSKPDIDVTPYELGEIAGVPLCFTDATALPNGAIVFTAAAENTDDAYLDGMCMGSIIGLIDAAGNLHSTHALDKTVKAEGIEATLSNGKIHLLLVTDADDATAPAQLYTAELDGYPF